MAIAMAVATAGCGALSSMDRDAGDGPSPAADRSAAVSGSVLSPGTPDVDPVTSARAWLRSYFSVSYTDPTPTSWLDRVEPVLTDELAQTYRRSHEDGSAGYTWSEFVASRCTSFVVEDAGTVPPEAPRTDAEVYVQVVGTLDTRCPADEARNGSESVAATLALIRERSGVWRVDQRVD